MCPPAPITFLKFTSCDNQGCIPILAVAVFESEIIEIFQSSHKMYNNNILNFEDFTAI